MPFVVIGNKLDEQRKVDTGLVKEEWINNGKADLYLETSAMKGKNIEDAF